MAEEKRVFLIRNPEIVTKRQAAYRAKIENNRAIGLTAFSSESFVPFKGWSIETSGATFDTILQLDEPSQELIRQRVVEPLQQLAQAHNITAIYPGKGDGPAHVVLQPGKFTNLTTDQIEAIKNYLSSNKSHLNMLAKVMEGITFHHDTLIVAAPTTYICAGQFDDEQGGAFRARKIIEQIINNALDRLKPSFQQIKGTFTPNYYHDIFHSSVMRLTQTAPSENLIAFAQEAYATIGKNLSKNPIPITLAGLYRGMAIDYQRQYVPYLMIP